MTSAVSSDVIVDGVDFGSSNSSLTENMSSETCATTSGVSGEDASSPVVCELAPDAVVLEAAIDAAADASLRIYLVRQDAEAAAMIDEARAAGDALFASKLKETAEAEAAAALIENAAAADLMRSEHTSPQEPPGVLKVIPTSNTQSTAASGGLIASEADVADGCPEPWESNPKFSPCRKFMAEFCTLHGTDPRSRCYDVDSTFFSCFMRCFAGTFRCGEKKLRSM
jgi:hypothetical protein